MKLLHADNVQPVANNAENIGASFRALSDGASFRAPSDSNFPDSLTTVQFTRLHHWKLVRCQLLERHHTFGRVHLQTRVIVQHHNLSHVGLLLFNKISHKHVSQLLPVDKGHG